MKLLKGRLVKGVISLLVIGLLLQPVQQVLAAEASLATEGPAAPEATKMDQIGQADKLDIDDSDPSIKDAETKKDEPAPEEDPVNEEAEQAEEELEEEPESPEGIPVPPPVPTVQLPPSTVKQKIVDADIASGALVYGYQLAIPAGRGGMQPDISLSYNSQQNEEGSLFGYGWSLGIPTIERKNVDGLNKLYASENFTSFMGGDLKKISEDKGITEFGAKIDSGSYLKYEFDSDQSTWTVSDKLGTKYAFGLQSEAKLSNPVNSKQVFRWHLSRVEDSRGNFVTYEYQIIDGQVYPFSVHYTGNGSNLGIFEIQFELQDRPDKAMSGQYGFMVKNTKRITTVKTLINNVIVGRYDMEYVQQSVNNRTQLIGVQYTGYDTAGQNGITDGGMQFAYESAGATDLLTKIIQNTGGVTKVTYKSSAQYRDDNGLALNPNLSFALQTVEKIEYDDRNGVTWQNTFQYAGGWFYYNGPMDRRFVGFEKVIRTDAAGNAVATFYHQGNGAKAEYGELADDWAKAGKSYKSELRNAQGALFSQSLNKWEFDRLAGAAGAQERSFVFLATTVNRTFDGNASHKDTASTYVYDEETGNLVSGIDFGEVEASDNGSFADIGTDKLTTIVTYAEPANNMDITGVPSGFIEKNEENVKVKEGKSYFDSLPFGQVGVGNATKEESWITGSTYAAVTRTYNSYGLPETETDPRNNTTVYTYDSAMLYPVTLTNALSQATTYEYDYRLGKPFKTTDANGLVSKITFDGLGRVVKEEMTRPGQNDPNVLFAKKTASYELYEQEATVRGWQTTETTYLDSHDSTTPREHKTITYTDGFDRPVQTRSLVESADSMPNIARYTVSDTTYNNIAQIDKTSLPYFSDGDSRTDISKDETLFASINYDAAYRVTATTNAVGVATNEYDDWKVTATDAMGKVKVLHKDAFDRLIKVEEHNRSEVYETEYEYDAQGNLVKMTDALGNERKFEYDGLGRRTLAEDLHAENDKTYGIWEYVYDAAGNLSQRTDANGAVVNYSYDALNRVTTENETSNSTADVSYVYDNCIKGIGRLCSVTNSAVVANYEYDVLGQIKKESKVIDSQTYVTEYSYDRQGNQLLLKNPDGSQVKYSYNIGGAIETVESKENGTNNFGFVVLDIDYAPTGGVTYQELSNGAKVTNTYDATQLYRLTSRVGTLPFLIGDTKTVQNYTYTYDAVGNIASIADTSELDTRKTMQYFYDDLHRLTIARSSDAADGQNYEQSYSYDAIGNITYKSDVGTYQYDGNQGESYANPHAVTSIMSPTTNIAYEYDRNGNMLSDGDSQYAWDYNNRIKYITPNGPGALPISYGYDANGMRVSVVVRSAPSTHYPTQFFNSNSGLSGAGVQKHVFAGEAAVATIKGTGGSARLFAMHTDHLGSTAVVSDASGELTETVDYYPFGAVRHSVVTSGNTEQRKYIGQEYDAETELSYLQARYYDGKLGRFLSQDAVHLSFGNTEAIKQITGQELQAFLNDPQSFNSYSYSRNNPVNLKDPGGEWWNPWEYAKEKAESGLDYVKQQAQSVGNYAQNQWQSWQANREDSNSEEYKQKQSEGLKYGNIYVGNDRYIGVTPGSMKSVGPTLVNGLKLGQSFGRYGQVIENIPGKIETLSDHAAARFFQRPGLSMDTIAHTVFNPLVRFAQPDGKTIGYLSDDAYVVLDKVTNKVVTWFSKDEFEHPIKNILNQAKR